MIETPSVTSELRIITSFTNEFYESITYGSESRLSQASSVCTFSKVSLSCDAAGCLSVSCRVLMHTELVGVDTQSRSLIRPRVE